MVMRFFWRNNITIDIWVFSKLELEVVYNKVIRSILALLPCTPAAILGLEMSFHQ